MSPLDTLTYLIVFFVLVPTVCLIIQPRRLKVIRTIEHNGMVRELTRKMTLRENINATFKEIY